MQASATVHYREDFTLQDFTADASAKKPARVRAVPAVTRAIAILRLLGEHRGGLGVKAIADHLELVPSTCLHILRALVTESLVAQDASTKRYRLSSGMVSLARSALEATGFVSVARPQLEKLARKWGLTFMGVELTTRETMVVTLVARPDQPLQLHASVGSEFSYLTSATGRLVAAHIALAPQELRFAFREVRWDQPVPFDQWCEEVEAARVAGWSIDSDCYRSGLTALAVPLTDGGKMTHSLVAMGLTAEILVADQAAIIRDLKHARNEISQEISVS